MSSICPVFVGFSTLLLMAFFVRTSPTAVSKLSQNTNIVATASGETSFILAFSKERNTPFLQVYVGLIGSVTASVTVSLLGTGAVLKSFNLADGNSKLIELHEKLAVKKSEKYKHKTILITSTVDIMVIAYSGTTSNEERKSASAFLVLPVSQLSTFYIVVTSCSQSECFILVASQADDTDVQVRLTLKALPGMSSTLQYDGDTYQHGSVLEETLEEDELFQLLGEQVDLSGSLISSNKPIAVMTGGTFDQSLFSDKKDKAVEQIPPVQGLGTSFVLRGLPLPAGRWYRVHIAMPHLHTKVDYPINSAFVQVQNFSDLEITLRVTVDETIFLTADKPVLVILGLPGRESTSSKGATQEKTDAGFILAMPVDMWKSEFTVFVNDIHGRLLTHTIVLMTLSTCQTAFQVNGQTRDKPSWKTSGDYKSGSISLPEAFGLAHIANTACVFGGYVTSTTMFKSWTFTLGWEAKIPLNKDPGPDLLARTSKSLARETSTTEALSTSTAKPMSTTPSLLQTSRTQSTSHLHFTSTSTFSSETASTSTDKASTISTSLKITSTQTSTTSDILTASIESSTTSSVIGQDTTIETSTQSMTATPAIMSTRSSTDMIWSQTQLSMDGIITTLSPSVEQFSTQLTVTTPDESTTTEAEGSTTTEAEGSTTTEAEGSTTTEAEGSTTTEAKGSTTTEAEGSTTTEAEVSTEATTGKTNSYTLKLCPCECTTDLSWISNLTTEEKEESTKAIVRRLHVDKSTVSKTIRRKISAPDERPSSTGYGSIVTGFVLLFVLGFVIIPDALCVVHALCFAQEQK